MLNTSKLNRRPVFERSDQDGVDFLVAGPVNTLPDAPLGPPVLAYQAAAVGWVQASSPFAYRRYR